MSEGCGLLVTYGTDISKPLPQFHGICTVGVPGISTHVLISSPSGSILKRGAEGELHLGGPAMVDLYLGDVQSELFYTDEAGNWIKTGRQGIHGRAGICFHP